MGGDLLKGGLAIVAGVITLAMISVILSQQAQSATVINALSSGLAQVVGAAVAPVTGSGNVSTPTTFLANLGSSTYSSPSISSTTDSGGFIF